MARISRKQLKQDEFVDAAVGAQHWLEANWRMVAAAAGAVVAIVLIVVGWLAWSSHRQEQARERLSLGITQFQKATAPGVEAGQLEPSLATFDEVVASAGTRGAGAVASYYRGIILLRLGRLDEATEALRAVVEGGDDVTPILHASAQVMLAEVHAAAGRTDEAARLLEELAGGANPTYPPEEALAVLARIYDRAGDEARARQVWQRIVEQHPQSGAAREAGTELSPAETDRS